MIHKSSSISIFFIFLPVLIAGYFLCSVSLAGASVSDVLPVAMRTFGIWEPRTGERLDFSVWYPGGKGGEDLAAVKEGWVVSAARRGRIIPGLYPVVLISHDTASSRYASSDLAVMLASGGFIVIAPSHYGDNQSDNSGVYTAELLRDRPRQLLRALETVLESPDFSTYVDESRIGLLGIGFGGISVLQLAGASPDFSSIAEYCSRSEKKDAFCAPWVRGKLVAAGEKMNVMSAGTPPSVLCPPLSLYAPKLVPVEIPKDILLAYETLHTTPKAKGSSTFWKQLFSRERERSREEERGASERATGSQDEEKASDTAAASAAGDTGEHFPLELDFQGGELFGGTDSGSPYVHIAMSDSPEFRVSEGESSTIIASPESASDKADSSASMVFRRPAEVRRILAIAMISPAGGMLYNAESLQRVTMPVAMIEASKDTLYPPEEHAEPFYAWLPAPPSVLRLPESDHFSLYAPCSEESLENLGELCGSQNREERELIVEQRDNFIVHFFQSSMGGALPPPAQPSGFIAAPNGH